MGAIADLSDLVNRATGGNDGNPETIFFYKDSRIGTGLGSQLMAGRYSSMWLQNGVRGTGSIPTSAGVPARDADGALKQTNPGGGRQKWIVSASASANTAGTLMIYDRLIHSGGLSGTVTTAQSVTASVTRYTGAESVGNFIWLEIYTQLGTGQPTVRVTYTNQDGDSALTMPVVVGGTNYMEAQRMLALPLAAGDTGVQGVTSVTLSGSTNVAGNFGIVVGRPLGVVSCGTLGAGAVRDFISAPGPVEVKTDACLALAYQANSSTNLQLFGSVTMVEA